MAIRKAYGKDGKSCQVTFTLPAELAKGVKTVRVVGEFNDWNTSDVKGKMKKNKSGNFSATVSLEKGKQYQFRYYIDNSRWENDKSADGIVHVDEMASDNSIVSV
jgi:1,4-alpha-glucan branching enzyme